MIKEAIIKLTEKQDLTFEEAYQVMCEIMTGEASDVQKSAYLTALAMKGETVDEITGSAKGMAEQAAHLDTANLDVFEIVGTGGDKSNSFNISTTSSIVISSAGVPVAKHGNRAASSKSGAADVLEALGVNIMAEPETMAKSLRDTGLAFMHAQKYHPAMRFVGPIRKELGIRTVFNILGPLTNPAGAKLNVIGVFNEEMVETIAHVLVNLGVKKGIVVYGMDKLDEISMSSETAVCEFEGDNFKSYKISPEQFGYTRCTKDDLVGGTPEDNAQITRDILDGKKGPKRDAVCLNAGAGLYVAGKAATLADGVKMAEQLIDSGAAKAQLEKFVKATNA